MTDRVWCKKPDCNNDYCQLMQARANLSLAEEGLANYARELENAKHDIERLMESVSGEANEVERLRAGNERLKARMRTVAGWLNNGCEPSKGAGELLLVAGLPPPQPCRTPEEG